MKPPRNPPSLKDIAAAVGVSAMTVSNVLRPRPSKGRMLYSDETAQRVLKAAQELGYVPNRAARAMRTQKTGVVGFVAANFSEETGTVENYTVLPFLVGLNHVLSPSRRHVVLIELQELEEQKSQELPAALTERFFDGLVVHYGLSSRALHLLEEFKIPLIYWDSGIFGEENCVYRNEFEAGRAVTQRLIDLGHRRIGFHVSRSSWERYQSGRTVHYSFVDRYEGFAAALKGSSLRPKMLLGYLGEELAEQIEAQKLTAAVVQGTNIEQLNRATRILGSWIPKDFSVLSCDIEASVKDRGTMPGGARYNRYQAGRTVGELLIERLENEGVPVASRCLPMDVADGTTAVAAVRK